METTCAWVSGLGCAVPYAKGMVKGGEKGILEKEEEKVQLLQEAADDGRRREGLEACLPVWWKGGAGRMCARWWSLGYLLRNKTKIFIGWTCVYRRLERLLVMGGNGGC